MSQISLAQVKKNLSGTWAKESDLSETYVFAFTSDTQWSCTRKNGQGERKFRLAYDKAGEKLWWGESYFLDPVELNTKPAKAQWYRASDRAQKKAAFLWRKTAEATAAELRAIEALARVPSKVVTKGTGKSDVARGAKGVGKSDVAATPKWVPAPRAAGAVGPAAGERAEVGKSTRGRGAGSTWPLPEVVVDLEQMLVIYKPPYWKCELPAADTLDDPPQADRKRDNPFLLRWVKEAVKDIDAELYKEDFNPAISGTGFGPLSHRIDQETSGLLLVAKTKGAQRHLKAQFHKTEVSKRYICLVRGKVAKAKGVIDARIRTIRTDAMSRSEVSSSGEWAETTYQVVATYHGSGVEHHNAYSLLACDITTGRTHQIRVHMAHIGHPLVADDKYLSEAQLQEDRASVCPRLFLHSYRLCFCDINGKHMQVLCPIPDDLRLALANLGASDPSRPSSDSLFGENSWQRELVRPEVLQWRPGTRLLRRVASLVQDFGRSWASDAEGAEG
ncbi:unnamed protein product [Prorocentrum cordatum]|uniref:Pseudouridine synthase RsuA/RluA-like domain-containing protein n=1 Tax=Prorocentrum cordatum TaxID=2364126 RepID=A0ABN9UN30_9DINO|nr:unnamed protein product [Polarella glacialis]